MQCLTDNGAGMYQLADPQPTEYTTCTYVLAQQPDIAINAWALTASQGLQIATAIAICWAAAFAFRVIGQFLNQSSKQNESE